MRKMVKSYEDRRRADGKRIMKKTRRWEENEEDGYKRGREEGEKMVRG
jgi:hypothetical protein